MPGQARFDAKRHASVWFCSCLLPTYVRTRPIRRHILRWHSSSGLPIVGEAAFTRGRSLMKPTGSQIMVAWRPSPQQHAEHFHVTPQTTQVPAGSPYPTLRAERGPSLSDLFLGIPSKPTLTAHSAWQILTGGWMLQPWELCAPIPRTAG